MKIAVWISVFVTPLFFACTNGKPDDNPGIKSTPIINYTVTHAYPHDTTAFTEGLLVHNGQLFESTGAAPELPQTRSLFGTLDTVSGKITPKAELDKHQYFGEGIAFLKDKVYQLTYQTKVGFIYDATTFQKLGAFTFPSKEGWGLTTDGASLIMSDGTSLITYLDAGTLQPVKTLTVTDENGTVNRINELEWINGFIYANIYETTDIVKIDPSTGQVTARLDLSSVANEARSRYAGAMEMNGIAYDAASGKVFITGKMWPMIYEI